MLSCICYKIFFEIDKKTCNACVKLLEKDTRINPRLYVLWKDNAKYRVLSDLHHSYVEYIFHRELITGISGKISDGKLDIHLNALFNYDLTPQL